MTFHGKYRMIILEQSILAIQKDYTDGREYEKEGDKYIYVDIDHLGYDNKPSLRDSILEMKPNENHEFVKSVLGATSKTTDNKNEDDILKEPKLSCKDEEDESTTIPTWSNTDYLWQNHSKSIPETFFAFIWKLITILICIPHKSTENSELMRSCDVESLDKDEESVTNHGVGKSVAAIGLAVKDVNQ